MSTGTFNVRMSAKAAATLREAKREAGAPGYVAEPYSGVASWEQKLALTRRVTAAFSVFLNFLIWHPYCRVSHLIRGYVIEGRRLTTWNGENDLQATVGICPSSVDLCWYFPNEFKRIHFDRPLGCEEVGVKILVVNSRKRITLLGEVTSTKATAVFELEFAHGELTRLNAIGCRLPFDSKLVNADVVISYQEPHGRDVVEWVNKMEHIVGTLRHQRHNWDKSTWEKLGTEAWLPILSSFDVKKERWGHQLHAHSYETLVTNYKTYFDGFSQWSASRVMELTPPHPHGVTQWDMTTDLLDELYPIAHAPAMEHEQEQFRTTPDYLKTNPDMKTYDGRTLSEEYLHQPASSPVYHFMIPTVLSASQGVSIPPNLFAEQTYSRKEGGEDIVMPLYSQFRVARSPELPTLAKLWHTASMFYGSTMAPPDANFVVVERPETIIRIGPTRGGDNNLKGLFSWNLKTLVRYQILANPKAYQNSGYGLRDFNQGSGRPEEGLVIQALPDPSSGGKMTPDVVGFVGTEDDETPQYILNAQHADYVYEEQFEGYSAAERIVFGQRRFNHSDIQLRYSVRERQWLTAKTINVLPVRLADPRPSIFRTDRLYVAEYPMPTKVQAMGRHFLLLPHIIERTVKDTRVWDKTSAQKTTTKMRRDSDSGEEGVYEFVNEGKPCRMSDMTCFDDWEAEIYSPPSPTVEPSQQFNYRQTQRERDQTTPPERVVRRVDVGAEPSTSTTEAMTQSKDNLEGTKYSNAFYQDGVRSNRSVTRKASVEKSTPAPPVSTPPRTEIPKEEKRRAATPPPKKPARKRSPSPRKARRSTRKSTKPSERDKRHHHRSRARSITSSSESSVSDVRHRSHRHKNGFEKPRKTAKRSTRRRSPSSSSSSSSSSSYYHRKGPARKSPRKEPKKSSKNESSSSTRDYGQSFMTNPQPFPGGYEDELKSGMRVYYLRYHDIDGEMIACKGECPYCVEELERIAAEEKDRRGYRSRIFEVTSEDEQ